MSRAIVVDVESDGPCPGRWSMVSFGAVAIIDGEISRNDFYSGTIKPISSEWIPEALAISNISREDHENALIAPREAMESFHKWTEEVSEGNRPIFYSDNNGFDWQWINYYFHTYFGQNIYGFSSQNIGSIYKGMKMSPFENFKHLRDTKHTHHPTDDAKGNAEALIKMKKMGYKIGLK